MRKSGLHKQVASIFEGVPKPNDTAPRSLAQRLASEDASPANADQKRSMTPDHTERPVVQKRPRPAPKSADKAETSLLKKGAGPKPAAKSRTTPADPAAQRQKKMTVLVGVLSVVFLGVLFISLGGVGQPQSKANAGSQTADEAAVPTVSQFDPDAWAFPKPLPAQMRDPLVIPTPKLTMDQADPVEKAPELVIRGIVYSDSQRTVIIGDQIATEGQMLADVRIVKITRHAVELERDGKRWTQGVESKE